MTDPSRSVPRRTVLRTAAGGLTGLAGLGAAGSATATDFQSGDCVRLVVDAQLWGQACPTLEDRGRKVRAGDTGTVHSFCTDDDGREFGLFTLNGQLAAGWLNLQAVEHC